MTDSKTDSSNSPLASPSRSSLSSPSMDCISSPNTLHSTVETSGLCTTNTSTITIPPTEAWNSGSMSPAPSVKPSKKRTSFFSFLTVREPSTQAWIDYQENVRKQQASDEKRPRAVGMPMVSTAKLPSTVPRVNSKWEGVPHAVIRKEKQKKSGRRSSATTHGTRAPSIISTGSGASSHESIGPVHPSRLGSTTSFPHSDIFCGRASPRTLPSIKTKDFATSVDSVAQLSPSDWTSTSAASAKSTPQTPLSDDSLTSSLPRCPPLPLGRLKDLQTLNFASPAVTTFSNPSSASGDPSSSTSSITPWLDDQPSNNTRSQPKPGEPLSVNFSVPRSRGFPRMTHDECFEVPQLSDLGGLLVDCP